MKRETMRKIFNLCLLLLAMCSVDVGWASAAGPTIVETDDKVIVEYVGVPTAAATETSPVVARAKLLSSLISALAKEGEEVLKQGTGENLQQLKDRRKKAQEILEQMETYKKELVQLQDANKERLDVLKKELQEIGENNRRYNQEMQKTFSTAIAPARDRSPKFKVCCVSALETERAYNYVTYSVKADIDNSGESGEVLVKLVAKNRDGHQIDFVYLRGFLEARESRTFTTTTMMTYQEAMDARQWEVESVTRR